MCSECLNLKKTYLIFEVSFLSKCKLYNIFYLSRLRDTRVTEKDFREEKDSLGVWALNPAPSHSIPPSQGGGVERKMRRGRGRRGQPLCFREGIVFILSLMLM